VPGSGFGNGLAKLIAALNTDFDWLRDHTRYLQRAIEWDTGGRPANRLLSGDDIAQAKTWVARRPKGAPEPTPLHLDFIRASEEEAAARLSEQRKQLEAVAAAQASRETALHDREEALKQAADAQQRREEAVKQAADAQRRRARIRNIALVAVSSLTLVAVLFALLANQLRTTAENQRQQADEILARATTIIAKVQENMDTETKHTAFALFDAGAKHGDATSMLNLGIDYYKGYSIPQDYAKAREWFEKAADKGDADAMVGLGWLYADGSGVTQDYTKARELFKKAADKGNADAMVRLGWLYANGSGVTQDYAKARDWFEKAADKGDASAMDNLGKLGVLSQDYTKAREWLERAADKGDASAMDALGWLYANGSGVTQDYAKAREWFEKAAAKGNVDAKADLETLSITEAAGAGR
jgi:TPR repeat protein